MPRQKRASEKELNKDIYDAGEDDRFAEVPDPGQGMTRASQDVIKQRKIFKVSRRKFGRGNGPGTPAPAAPKPAVSVNPFASTSLLKPKASSDEPPSKPNPFANIAFASNTDTASKAAPKPTFSFGSTPSATAPKPSTSTGFSFASKAAPSSLTPSQPTPATAPPKSLLSTPKSPKNKKQRIKELNKNFLHMIVDHWEGRMFASDYSHFMKEYQAHAEKLQLSDGEAGSETVDAPAAVAATANNNSKTTSSWAAPASSPAVKAFSFGSSAAPPTTTTFSFGSKPSAAPAAAAPSFSFGAPASSPAASAPPAATRSNGDNDDPTSNPDDGEVEKIEAEENTEEEVLHEVRAKNMKMEKGQWKKFGAGVLRLYRHKVNSKCRIVIRNGIGKVQFNVGVSKGMEFEKVIKQSKKGPATYVKFFAIEDASKGMEVFMLQVKPDCLDKLHEKLEGMVK
mmetsp:Transcript_3553/g.7768  ORF Transcript_3553/g.7768 Transcript_3553/m.7768 type:complete len:453 (-) Transcript_3553:133-1491(-)